MWWPFKSSGLKKPIFKKWWFKWGLGLALFFFIASLLPVLLYAVVDPPTTPLMWIRWMESDRPKRSPLFLRDWRPLNEISPRLARAVISAEDQKFFMHNGFDWEAAVNALEVNLTTKRKIGASTISMQTARNVFLWQERNWLRKGLEAYFTFLIETFWSKRRILEVYLNVIEWGDGVFGCEAATQKYFKHSTRNISRYEAAWMAAILPNPRAWPRARHHRRVHKRQERILRVMQTLKLPAI
ncbi:MAG: monofunctional biosynthetic peptidoglycan transglycosylase [Nitrospinaceae bacterium]|nr:monofunctional biosynthetic peptidoglycan transglycosylase [Nitrospinaceae bacterium]NIR54397.1 monofunctional biosynthetic peptidoglycan transglycosylase [Nitrospinaceae bacterium]NIS84811.1 monofunctional biosynthetic peptidoglycan transglycosylase [Nitrospinaceae bacterium]NIT81616.1 monofunctional biosynthetic peptidoglycan transglycosylase [Nitrospinaceae bacterium]NIU43899.1 monofunctional biosynthetic peptidoglycan transglycosylase [Nitrospinaceae bacterium]